MLELFGEKYPRLLGIDISSTSIKVLELSKTQGRYKIESYAVAPLPQGSIVENVIKNLEEVSRAITLAISLCGTSLKNAAVAVTSSAVITKILQVDATLQDLELEAQVNLEAARFIPYPLDEVALDFEVLGLNASNQEKVDVLVVASREENVEARTSVLRLANLVPKVVDVESYAIERACKLIADQLPNKGENKIIAIVDIGSALTNITILHNFKTLYTREEVFGGKQLTEAIQRRYGLSYEEAGLSKKQSSDLRDYGPALLEPFKESLVPLIRRSLQFFFASSPYTEIDHIVLAGGGAMISGLKEVIQERLGTETSIANPFTNMEISSNIKDVSLLAADAPALMICCGLALRSFSE